MNILPADGTESPGAEKGFEAVLIDGRVDDRIEVGNLVRVSEAARDQFFARFSPDFSRVVV